MVEIERFGDDALIARCEDGPARLEAKAARLRAEGRFEEIVPTIGVLTARFDPASIDRDEAEAALSASLSAELPPTTSDGPETLTLPIRYDGEDLPTLAGTLGLDEDEIAAAHQSAVYEVLFLGFTPGFAYLGGLDPRLEGARRLETPRTRVPPGSVGIAGGRCGVYGLEGPGGWPLIGTTTATLFDPDAADPFRLKPGTRIRFERDSSQR